MCRTSVGCRRPMISVHFVFDVESLELPTPCGQRNAVGGLGAARFRMQRCGDVAPTRLAGERVDRTEQIILDTKVGGCATDVRK